MTAEMQHRRLSSRLVAVARLASAYTRQLSLSTTSPPPPPSSTMASAYVFTLQPTFTQGLILGQASILFLLFLVLKYLFFDTDPDRPYRKASYPPKVEEVDSDDELPAARVDFSKLDTRQDGEESSEWLNVFLQQVRLSVPRIVRMYELT